MQIKSSKILDGYSLVIFYPEDKEYALFQPLFKIYGLAVTDTQSNVAYVDGGAFEEQNLDNDYLDAIDAHEMAHVILGHGVQEPNPTEEIEADYFAILLLKAFGYVDAANILIDNFQVRHNILYDEVEAILNPDVSDYIFAFMTKYFSDIDVMNEAYQITREFFTILANKKIKAGKQKLMENRVDDAHKIAQANNVGDELFHQIQNESGNIHRQHKYLMWILNQVIQNNITDPNKIQNDIIKPLIYFHEHAAQFAQKDINSYATLIDLVNAVNTVQSRERRTFNEMHPGEKIYENDKIQIFCPTTHKSSCYYGAGTKWCTASNNLSYYEDYKEKGELYYILDKTKPTDDETYKLAIRFVFRLNGSGYDIAEIRSAPNDRMISMENFLSYIGQDAYNAIIVDLETRRELEVLANSFDKLKAKYDVNPKEVLAQMTFDQLMKFGEGVGLISNPLQLCELLVKYDINPLTKIHVNYHAYFGYLVGEDTSNMNHAIVQFVDEYDAIHPNTLFKGLIVQYAGSHVFNRPKIVVYFKTKFPDQWGTMLATTVLGWYETNLDNVLGNLTEYFVKIDGTVLWHQFWEEWHGIAGLLKYIQEKAPNYWHTINRSDDYVGTSFSHLFLILQSASQYQNVLEIYNALKEIMPKLPIFKIIAAKDWVIGFNQIYGLDAGIKELVPFLIKNKIDIFAYLDLDTLNTYYGSMHETMASAIQYYTDDGDSDALLKFLAENITLKDQITYFEVHPTSDETDALLSVIKLYDTDFFDYWTIDELVTASDQDVEFLERVFTAADLSDTFNDNVSDLKLYQVFMSHISSKDLPEDQKLMYKQKAFNIANMSDVRYNSDGTIDLIVKDSDSGLGAFVDWFYDGDVGYSHANPRYVAKKLFVDDDDFWEPYSDIMSDFEEDVWDITNAKTIQYIRDYIKKNILPVDIYPADIDDWDEDDYADELNDGYFVLTPERLDQLSDDELCDIIQHHDDFENLKDELRWAYDEAYNAAILNQWREAYVDAILETVEGATPKWEKTGKINTHRYEHNGEIKEYTSEEQIFVIPNIAFYEVLNIWATENIDYETEFQYNFIGTVEENLKQSDDLLTPDPSEWPDSNTVEEYYNEHVHDRI